jgi:hypothetical protein
MDSYIPATGIKITSAVADQEFPKRGGGEDDSLLFKAPFN